VTTRALGWGGVAATALMAFYVSVLAASGGWAHLADQTQSDWWLVAPIAVAFGSQVALTVELRHRHRAHHLAAPTGAGTGASTVGMVACCAHHLADLVPLMAGGLVINLAAVAVAGRRLFHLTHPTTGSVSCAA